MDSALAAALAERINQSRLYGLFLPVEIDINWKTNSVTELATQFYNGDTTIAPILADELEETGCNNTLWLRILRECPEVYHKGMTFIDNLLDKNLILPPTLPLLLPPPPPSQLTIIRM